MVGVGVIESAGGFIHPGRTHLVLYSHDLSAEAVSGAHRVRSGRRVGRFVVGKGSSHSWTFHRLPLSLAEPRLLMYDTARSVSIDMRIDDETSERLVSEDVLRALRESMAVPEFTTRESPFIFVEIPGEENDIWSYIFREALDKMGGWTTGLPDLEFLDRYNRSISYGRAYV